MQRSTRRFSSAPGAAVLALSVSGFAIAAASAADNDPYVRTARVSYSDLDLGRSADAQVLYSRIGRAARKVCRADYGATLRERAFESKCIVKAIDDAVQSVSNTNLTAAYVYATSAGKRSRVASGR